MSLSPKVPIVLAGVLLAACATEESTTLANPAATFCTEQGGTYETRQDASGAQTGVCVLATGETVDAWDYFRANAPS